MPRANQDPLVQFQQRFDSIEGLEAVAKLVEADLLGDEAVICLECPSKADVVGCLPPGLEIVRDLAGSASRVVMIEVAGKAP